MALTNIKREASGTPNFSSGYLNGTYTAATVTSTTSGAAIASGVMTLNLGFVPKEFVITNETDRITQRWTEGMNQGDYSEQAANGDRTLETDDKIVVSVATTGTAPVTFEPAATVVVTFDSGICTDNDTVTWKAIG